jgi:hypothetical protein
MIIVFLIVVARRAVEIDALQLRRSKRAELPDPVLDPSAMVLGIIIASPHSFYRHWIVDHHDGTAALVPDEIAGSEIHAPHRTFVVTLDNSTMAIQP